MKSIYEFLLNKSNNKLNKPKVPDNCKYLIACNLFKYDADKNQQKLFDNPGEVVENVMVFSNENGGKITSRSAKNLRRVEIELVDENGYAANKIEKNKKYFIERIDITSDKFNYDKIKVSKPYQSPSVLAPKTHHIIHRFYNDNEDYFSRTNDCNVGFRTIYTIKNLDDVCFFNNSLYIRDNNEYIKVYYDYENNKPERIPITK